MAGPDTIPFKQADSNGHYRSKQLPDDQADFLEMLNLPETGFGDVIGSGTSTPNQMTIYLDTTGKRITAFGGTGLVKTTTGTVSTVTAPTGSVVGTSDTQTLTNKTLNNCVINGLTGLTKADVGLANVDNTSDVNKPVSTAQQTALNLKEDKANKGVSLGYAGLDASGKVPAAQLPSTGASVYQGTWNAATNTPTIPAAAPGNNGWYYNVNVAGTTNINGINSWAVGDQIISNGTVWQKIPNAQAVNSVNGYTGTVVLTKADVGLGNVDNTSDTTKNSAVATLTNKTLTSPVINSPTGLVKADVGLSNVDNTSDATKNTAVATLTNKTLNSPAINTPTGITKADVGLGNVDNTSDASKNSAAVTLTNKTINGANNTLTVRLDADVSNSLPTSRLNSGTGASATTFWRGDGVWAPPAGGGDVLGPGSAVDGDVAIFNGASGKIIKTTGRQVGTLGDVTGPASAVTGRLTSFNGTTGKLIADSGKLVADVVTGPASAVSGSLATYNGTTGKIIQDGGKLIADVVTGPASSVDGEAALFSGTTGKVLKRSTKLIVGDTAMTGYAAGTVVVPRYATHPDAVIASPTAFDDHFEGSSLDAKWVVSSPDALRSVTVGGSHVVLAAQSMANDSTHYTCSMTQVLPNATNFKVSLKAKTLAWPHTIAGGLGYVDFIVRSVTPSIQGLKIRYTGAYTSGVGNVLTVQLYTGLNLNTLYATFYGQLLEYMQFRWTRSTWSLTVHGSHDGINWTQLYFSVTSATSGLSESILPTQVQLLAGGYNYGQVVSSLDWITFVNF
jgi:hypothetical protein